MQSKFLKLVAGLGATAALALYGVSAAQAHEYHHRHHHARSAYNSHPLTVTGHHHQYAVAAPDPWQGPAPVVTGPNYVAATIVSLPFRAVNSVFPASGDPLANPLVFVGAPVHVIAMAAEFPFYAVGTVFGAPPPVTY
jgi:hypothetical protein